MAYNHEYPYVDPNRFNTDWEIMVVKSTRQDMDQMQADWATYQSNLNAQWESYRESTTADLQAWKAKAEADLDAYKESTSAALNADLAAYKQSTTNALEAWKNTTLSDLDAWKAATTTDLNQWRGQMEASFAAYKSGMDKSFADLSASFTSLSSDVDGLRAAITAFESNVNASVSAMQTDIASFKTSVNQSIAQQNAAIAAMQTTVDGFNAQIPGLVNTYLNTLTPKYAITALRSNYPLLRRLIPDTQGGDQGIIYTLPSQVNWGADLISRFNGLGTTWLASSTGDISEHPGYPQSIIILDTSASESVKNRTFRQQLALFVSNMLSQGRICYLAVLSPMSSFEHVLTYQFYSQYEAYLGGIGGLVDPNVTLADFDANYLNAAASRGFGWHGRIGTGSWRAYIPQDGRAIISRPGTINGATLSNDLGNQLNGFEYIRLKGQAQNSAGVTSLEYTITTPGVATSNFNDASISLVDPWFYIDYA